MMQISDITNQVGRVSGSCPANMPYKEMAGNCEALSEEKQQKISNFVTPQPNKEGSVGTFTQDDDNQEKEEPPQRRVQFSVNKVRFLSNTPLLIRFKAIWRNVIIEAF